MTTNLSTRAAWYEKNGEARDVMVLGSLPLKAPGRGEVCVRLATSGVNPSDVKSRRARPLSDPWVVPHSDGAGVIEAVGEGVAKQRVGERVWIWNAQWQRAHGTASEFIVVPEAQAVKLPDNTDFAAGASCASGRRRQLARQKSFGHWCILCGGSLRDAARHAIWRTCHWHRGL